MGTCLVQTEQHPLPTAGKGPLEHLRKGQQKAFMRQNRHQLSKRHEDDLRAYVPLAEKRGLSSDFWARVRHSSHCAGEEPVGRARGKPDANGYVNLFDTFRRE
jgi:hypothetical protein